MVLAYGPAFMHLFGVDEQVVLDTWTVERFGRFRRYADNALKRGGGSGGI